MGTRRRLGGGSELDDSFYIIVGEGSGRGSGGLGRGVDVHRGISGRLAARAKGVCLWSVGSGSTNDPSPLSAMATAGTPVTMPIWS